MRQYESLQSAASGLLGEATSIAAESGVEFVIVGGWTPFLLNADPIPHPGTRDVDILFKDGDVEGALKRTIQRLLDRGYTLSAKHPFQVLRVLDVAGTDFVFNVDMLHPSESSANPEMFVDHLELPIPAREYREDLYFSKSIQLPESRFLFDGYVSPVSLDFQLPNGTKEEITVPLMRESGTVITKSKSVLSPKRTRDAFDIYVSLAQARDYLAVVADFVKLKESDRQVYNTLYSIKEAVDKSVFYENAARHLEEILGFDQGYEVARRVNDQMDQFFSDVDLPEKATLE